MCGINNCFPIRGFSIHVLLNSPQKENFGFIYRTHIQRHMSHDMWRRKLEVTVICRQSIIWTGFFFGKSNPFKISLKQILKWWLMTWWGCHKNTKQFFSHKRIEKQKGYHFMKSLTCVRNRIPLLISIQTQAKKGIVLTLSLFGLVGFS